MSLEIPTVSNLLGAQSPHYLAVALNTGGLSFASNSSDVTFLSVVRAEMPRGELHFLFRISEGFANNESLKIELAYVTPAGVTVTGDSLTLDDTNTPVTGGSLELILRGDPIPVGSIVSLVRTYTAGGQANNPVVAALVQLY